jgi:predicted amidophosphoribosyltransferase
MPSEHPTCPICRAKLPASQACSDICTACGDSLDDWSKYADQREIDRMDREGEP